MSHDNGTEPHAVVSTGTESVPLAGGRSRRTVNDVPILELSDAYYEKVADAQAKHVDPAQETEFLTNEVVYMHTAREKSHGGPDVVISTIGAATLDTAAKDCVGPFEASFSDLPPTWVASTNDDLAEVIAEHYGCPVKGIDEELSP
jgi:hypothetical protein